MKSRDVILSRAKDLHVLFPLLFAATAAGAQSAPSAPSSKIVTRQLGAATATTTELLGSIAAIRQLPNGNVLVNDQARRRVVMMDKSLNVVGVVADSTSSTANAYGARVGGLIAYRGDSTLFVDPASLSMLVIDPSGKIARVMAAPRPNDVNFLTGGAAGNPGFDAQGRLVYRTMDFGFRGGPGRGAGPGQPGFVMPTPPDSSALVRFDLVARKLDTVGFYKIPKTNVSMTQDANGRMSVSVMMNPLPVVDEWAVTSDGRVAIVRGRDYHVDFIAADGKVTSAEKIPYDWQRMTDDDKQRFLDSAKVAIEKQRDAARVAGAANPAAGGRGADIGAMMGGVMGGTPMVITMGGPPGGGGGGERRAVAGGDFQIPPVNMVPVSDLPDYKPVFGNNAVRADMDGNLWVRTIPTKVTTGGAIYEVINGAGKLIDRVQVPANSTIAGFGAGGMVYLGIRDASGLKMQRIPLK